MQERVAQTVGRLRISGLELALGAKLLLGLRPASSHGEYLAEFKVEIRCIRSQFQGLFILFFSLGHLPQHEIVFRHGLVGARGVGISGQQRIDRLLGEQSGGAAKIVEQVGIVGPLLQCGLQVRDRFGELAGFDLRNSEGSLLVSPLQMRDRLSRVALRQKCVAQKLMGRSQARI